MKIVAPASALDVAMNMVAMAADKRLDTPLRMVADKGSVAFCVNNPRAAISISTTTAASIEEKGSAAISAWRFAALLSAFSSRSTIAIKTTATSVAITSAGSMYRLPLLAEPIGALVIDPEIGRVDLATADCVKLFEVAAAAGTEQTRFYLNGVYLHSADGRLTAVGMDGTKMLRVGIAADHFSDDNRLIVPTAAATLLIRLLRQTKPDRVTLRRSRAVFAASAPGFEIVSRMIDAKFPDYRAVLPRAGANAASCQRADLIGALARLKAVAAGEMPLVALQWADGEPMRLFLARQHDAGIDPIAAQTRGSARMALSLAQLSTLLSEFKDDVLLLEAADRGLIIRQGDKFGLLMSCEWHEREVAA
jgi:DNA polymerase III subunit beta